MNKSKTNIENQPKLDLDTEFDKQKEKSLNKQGRDYSILDEHPDILSLSLYNKGAIKAQAKKDHYKQKYNGRKK